MLRIIHILIWLCLVLILLLISAGYPFSHFLLPQSLIFIWVSSSGFQSGLYLVWFPLGLYCFAAFFISVKKCSIIFVGFVFQNYLSDVVVFIVFKLFHFFFLNSTYFGDLTVWLAQTRSRTTSTHVLLSITYYFFWLLSHTIAWCPHPGYFFTSLVV